MVRRTRISREGAGAWAAFGLKNAECAAEFAARAQARKVSGGHSRVLYVDYDYGQRPGKKSLVHRSDGFRSDDSGGGDGSDGEGAHDRSGGGPRDSARDRRARGRSVTSTTRDVKRRQSREPERSRDSLTRRNYERSRSRGPCNDDDDTDGDGDHAMGRHAAAETFDPVSRDVTARVNTKLYHPNARNVSHRPRHCRPPSQTRR